MAMVSVIVTCYNVEAYIEQSLHSLLRQTLSDIEVIVVDDGSTDNTPSLIHSVADRDRRVIPVLLTENSVGGVATAANAGLDLATGTYVGFLDGDDFSEPEMFERLLDAARACDADLSMCRYQEVDTRTGHLADPADEFRWLDLDRVCYELSTEERKRFLQFVSVPWRKLYRRDMLESRSIRFPVGDYFYEDNPFHWFCLLSAQSIALVPEVLCYHRVARSGQTMHVVDERLLRMFDHHQTIRGWMDDNSFTADFESALLDWVIAQLAWIGPRTPPELRQTLYRRLRGIVAQYDDRAIRDALLQGQRGVHIARLVVALQHDNYAAFQRLLASEVGKNSPLVSAAYHLRYSGVASTARLTAKYARERFPDTFAGWRLNPRRPAAQEELMFALAVLDARLDRIEKGLAHRGATEASTQAPCQSSDDWSPQPNGPERA